MSDLNHALSLLNSDRTLSEAIAAIYEAGRLAGYAEGVRDGAAGRAKLPGAHLAEGESPELPFAALLEDLELTTRPYYALKRKKVNTVRELLAMSEQDLLNIRNFGQKSVDEIKDKLRPYGYALSS